MATSNVTPDRDRMEAVSSGPAVVIRLPGAAAAPVVQIRTRRGRLPRAVVQLHRVRKDRQLNEWRQQDAVIAERRAELEQLMQDAQACWRAFNKHFHALDWFASKAAAQRTSVEIAELLEGLRIWNAERRAVLNAMWWEDIGRVTSENDPSN